MSYTCVVSVQGMTRKLNRAALEAYMEFDECSFAGCNVGGGMRGRKGV
jgi:hypothetical protein